MCLNNKSGGEHLKIHVLTQAAMTKILQTACLKYKDLFLTVLKASSPRSGCQQIWLPGKGPLPVGCLLTLSSSQGGGKKSVGLSPYFMDANPVEEPYPHDLITNSITLGVRASTYEVKG